MRNIFHRLLPVMSLLCLPLFGGYTPVVTRQSLHLDGAQLSAITGKMAFQGGIDTREYLFTIIATAPPGEGLEGAARDFGPLADYRFFSQLSNFRHNSITQSAIIARNTRGQNVLNGIFLAPTYDASNTYRGYGRFHFNWGKTRVHDFYGRNQLFPWPDMHYLLWVQEDLMVRATGSPYEWLPANPSGW